MRCSSIQGGDQADAGCLIVGWIHFKNADPAYNVVISMHRVYLPLVLR